MLGFAWNPQIKSCFASCFCVRLAFFETVLLQSSIWSEGPVSPLEMLTSSSGLLTVSPYAVPQVGTRPSVFWKIGWNQLESVRVEVGRRRFNAFCSSCSVLNIFRQVFYFSQAAAHVECQEALCCQDPGLEASCRSRNFELQQLFQRPWAYSAQKHGEFHLQGHQTTLFTRLLARATCLCIHSLMYDSPRQCKQCQFIIESSKST